MTVSFKSTGADPSKINHLDGEIASVWQDLRIWPT
jgi:hypothetical protein